MKKIYMNVMFIFTLFITHSVFAINIVFVEPSNKANIFWPIVNKVAHAAAEDLDINIEIISGSSDEYQQLPIINNLIARNKKIDYVIFLAEDRQAIKSFSALEEAKIPFVTIERAIFPDLANQLGVPQQHFNYWLGEIYYDNNRAGQLLANSLFSARKHINKTNNNMNVVGITGDYSGDSSERSAGLMAELETEPTINLTQVVHGRWRKNIAAKMFEGLNHRYKNIDIVWTAADIMALGVSDVAISVGKSINTDIFIGGFDWSQEAILAIKENRLSASVGGHFMQVAWALVKLYDHYHGVNVFPKGGDKPTYVLQLIDRNNVKDYEVLLNNPDWRKVNFKQFSLLNNKSKPINEYDFSFEKVIKQLN